MVNQNVGKTKQICMTRRCWDQCPNTSCTTALTGDSDKWQQKFCLYHSLHIKFHASLRWKIDCIIYNEIMLVHCRCAWFNCLTLDSFTLCRFWSIVKHCRACDKCVDVFDHCCRVRLSVLLIYFSSYQWLNST